MIDGVAYTDGRQNSRSRNVLKLYRVLARAGAAKANSPQRHGEAGGPEVWAQPRDPGREPVRTAPSTAVQDRLEGWSFLRRAAAEHQPHLPDSMGGCGQVSADNCKTQAKLVCLKWGLWSQCGFDQCGKYPLGGTRLASLRRTLACSK